MKEDRGFTLIEVLVALAIVAIGMAAVLETLTSSANTALYLQDKTFAQWVALNRIETVRMSGNLPPPGTSDDDIDYAGRKWEWQEKVTDTRISGMVQIEIDVRPADSKAADDRGWYASAVGFMGNAIAPSNEPGPSWSQNPIIGLPPTSPNPTATNPSQQPPNTTLQ
ncbi:MAG TPA: type II secretion system minor pseudopilin GspI [Steroidobacteraceae bacterium]|nr:type II secretion system minor pseudopilin GspI [Steroidobacteraceae bacterium]